MFHESQKVFCACFIGAGLGSLFALETWPAFCWLGFLIGGLTGYLSYEFKNVLRAIPRAYRAATSFRFPKGFFTLTSRAFALSVCLIFWVLASTELIHSGSSGHENTGIKVAFPLLLFTMFIVCILMTIVITSILFEQSSIQKNGVKIDRDIEERCKEINFMLYCVFPPIVLFWHLPRGIIFLAVRLPEFLVDISLWILVVGCVFLKFCKDFFWSLFLQIHSEMRILCGVDATIGAAIGYFAGSALIGALAGGVIGLFNYVVVTELCLKRFGYIQRTQ